MKFQNTILCILDGWGNGNGDEFDAIHSTKKTCWQYLIENYPHTNIAASGEDVGLPAGQIGNSEVGHMNIGSGRIILQDLNRINDQIKHINKNPTLIEFIEALQKNNGNCHIMGLMSDGGVHSTQHHAYPLIDVIAKDGIRVFIHAFLDGRDTLPKSALTYLQDLKNNIENYHNVSVATISGRYYAMDRDQRLDRTKKAFDAITYAIGNKFNDASILINENYSNNISDEFIEPSVLTGYSGIKDGDGILIINFRSDRILQILSMFLNTKIDLSGIIGMVKYSDDFKIPCLFPPKNITNTLGEVIANNNLNQLRIAETEKYAHVTFFFNGGKEQSFAGEDRILIPSPKVSTYDLQPEMSAFKLTESLVENIISKKYALIIANYANADMVGHTGNFEATKQAIKAIDHCLSKLLEAAKITNSILIITADHGNAEKMFDDKSNMPYTAHTLNTVPFIICNSNKPLELKRNGRLCDIAPTILELLGIKQPSEMSGLSLILK